MYDRKKTTHDIEAVKIFLEFWAKFHSEYKSAISKDIISADEEARFFSSQAVVTSNYEQMMNSLEFKYMPHGRLTDPVSEILSTTSIRHISEENLKKLNEDWVWSYIFLNNILERLKNRKRRLEQFSPAGVYMKRFFDKILSR